MIIENVKERLSQAKEQIEFIKECLWLNFGINRNWKT